MEQTRTSAAPPRQDPRPKRFRWGWRVLILLVAALIVLAGFAAIDALGIARELERGRRHMREARSALVDGDAERALQSFELAAERFSAAVERSRRVPFRVLGLVPLAGRTPDALASMASAGADLADAGRGLSAGVAEVPGGFAALAPTAGRVPVGRLLRLSEEVARAEAKARDALTTIRSASSTWLVPPVGDARLEVEDQVEEAHVVLETATFLFRGLPAFLGADQPARYFFVAQNPAEIRGTGGLMGAYSILTIEEGRFDFSRFDPVQDLPVYAPGEVPPPSEEYAVNYDRYGGAGFLLNANMTPDFPTASRAILAVYQQATGDEIDGVIAADPHALRALLEITGPVSVPRLGIEVDADNVVAFTANEAYAQFPTPERRKRVLGDVAEVVFARFLDEPGRGIRKLRALGSAAAEGHVRAFAVDPAMQEGFVRSGVAGALTTPDDGADLLSVVTNNAAGNKVDFYEDRRIEHEVVLGPDGTAQERTVVHVTNGAPTEGYPRYVIGPHRSLPDVEAGENVTILQLYCSPRCGFEEATRDGEPIRFDVGTELGRPFLRDGYRVRSEDSSELVVRTERADVWEGNSSGGRYHLTVVGQPTIRPTELQVEITAPYGMSITHANVPMEVEGDRATWTGMLSGRLDLRIEFRPSLPVRMWRNVVRFFTQPVIRL